MRLQVFMMCRSSSLRKKSDKSDRRYYDNQLYYLRQDGTAGVHIEITTEAPMIPGKLYELCVLGLWPGDKNRAIESIASFCSSTSLEGIELGQLECDNKHGLLYHDGVNQWN